jgi:hypothetical protein
MAQKGVYGRQCLATGERGIQPGALHRSRNGWLRRVSPIAAPPGDGFLSEPKAGTQPRRREPLFVPLCDHSLRSAATAYDSPLRHSLDAFSRTSQCRLWVTGGKTLSEYMFSRSDRITDILATPAIPRLHETPGTAKVPPLPCPLTLVSQCCFLDKTCSQE